MKTILRLILMNLTQFKNKYNITKNSGALVL